MHGRRIARFLASGVAVAVVCGALAAPAPARVERPPGAGKPTPGSGIGTSAALGNPRCVLNERTEPYGRFDSTAVGEGPVCVKPWKDGDDNGGATYQGVTKDRVKVVWVVPNEIQRSTLSRAAGNIPVNRATDEIGTFEDAVHDYLLPLMKYHETWGRDIEVTFVTSTGDDEAAQRADAVRVKAERPFAVINLVRTGLSALEAELAREKILVFSSATTTSEALGQAPYRWGLSDARAGSINAAEVIGKQLVGKKAEFAGDDALKKQTRRFAAVYIPTQIDVDQLASHLGRFGGKLTSEHPYESSGATVGDATSAQQQAPLIVTKMKDAGVTTVILFSDLAMTQSMMAQATNQAWYPEWFFTGALFGDLGIFARTYDPAQSAHAFGISNLAPYTTPDPQPAPPEKPIEVLTDEINWYWGEGVGTQVSSVVPSRVRWLLSGIHAAGPKLTPKTFRQGLFSIPATGGAASGETTTMLRGFGRTPGLPYDEYLLLNLDFAPVWWDPDTTGPSTGTGTEGKGVMWYLDGAKRYQASTWPKKQFTWFDKKGAVTHFETRQPPIPIYAGDCTGCPSQGGPGQVGTPSPAGFVAQATIARTSER